MKSARILILGLALALAPILPVSLHAAPAAQTEVAQRIRERLDAYGRGDATAWSTFVADDCFCAADTKSDIVRSITSRPAGIKSWYGEIRNLDAHAYGDTVVVRYRITELTEVGGKLNSLDEWRTETHVRRSGNWMLVAASESPIAPDPKPVTLPREVLLRYVGRYQYTPGSVDVVTLEGDRLFVEPTSDPKVELFAENSTTFFAKGQEWRLVFTTDPNGAVTAMTFRQQGQEYVASRIADSPP